METIWYTLINEWTAQECYDLQICYQSLMKHSQWLGVNVYFYMLDSSIPYLMCFRNTTSCNTSMDWFIEDQQKNIVTIDTASHNDYQSSRV